MNDLQQFQDLVKRYKATSFKGAKERYMRKILNIVDKYFGALWIKSMGDRYTYGHIFYIDFTEYKIMVHYKDLLGNVKDGYVMCSFSDGTLIEDVISKNAKMTSFYLKNNELFSILISPLNIGDQILNAV